MIFSPAVARQIARGDKTTHRIPVVDDKPCRFKVGHDYAVQPGKGKEPMCRVTVTTLTDLPLLAMPFEWARREGFKTTIDFKADWLARVDGYDDVEDMTGSEVEWAFAALHATDRCHVLTLAVVADPVRFLARTNRPNDKGELYTQNRAQAVDDAEAVPEGYQARLSADAVDRGVTLRAERVREAMTGERSPGELDREDRRAVRNAQRAERERKRKEAA